MTDKRNIPAYQILFVDTPQQLINMANCLLHASEIAFDTEYDSFKREYGFKLLLMQIFDGKDVYIIDPLALSDLTPLLDILENEKICKVVYSGSEDIALMKKFNCSVKNIFDVQVAATLCNHEARNLGDLIESYTGEPADKSQQKSDWRPRPLTAEQIEYAANDVLHLIGLKNNLAAIVEQRGLTSILNEENKAMEDIPEREHIPKLKPHHFKNNSQAWCDALMRMIELRDKIARDLNLPPVRVVDTQFLEDALNKRDSFLASKELKSFHPKIRNSESLKKQFLRIVESYDPNDLSRRPREPRLDPFVRKPFLSKEQQQEIIIAKYEPIKSEYVEKYGERAAEFLLRGLKKEITSIDESPRDLHEYQLAILQRMKDSNP